MAKLGNHHLYEVGGVFVASFLLFFLPAADAAGPVIPADPSELNSWFQANVKPLRERKGSLDPELVTAEDKRRVIKVSQDGSGEFKTVTDALNSIQPGNTGRVVINIGPGTYKEKIKVERTKPFVTFYGDPKNLPTLTYDGTAAEYGTVDSASVIVESDYFVCANVIITNSAPRPDGKRKGAQALALRISGDKASFYNCRITGFQDTICDDKGRHFFKKCYIEGTVDFIFGSGKALYLDTELHVVPGDPVAIIAAQARSKPTEDTGYAFVHCTITGTGSKAFLGRAWMSAPRVVYLYSTMSNVIRPEGWSDNFQPSNQKTVYFGEYNNRGPGSNTNGRVKYAKQLTDAEANTFLTLDYIEGTKWLLPPPKPKM